MRKLIEIGGSLGLTLPAIWIQKMKLKAGDILEVDYTDYDITVRPKKK